MIDEVVFWGAGGHAKVLRECMRNTGIQLTALFDNDPTIHTPFSGIPIYYAKEGFLQWLTTRRREQLPGALVAIGGDRGKVRLEVQEFFVEHGLQPLIAKHQTSYVSDNVPIGLGSHILAHAVVGVDAAVGRACIINTAATLDHECILGDGVHLCPGSHLAGCVTVGDFATIGSGAVVAPRISIGEGAVIGAGAVVIRHVAPYTVVVGNPGRVIRHLVEGT